MKCQEREAVREARVKESKRHNRGEEIIKLMKNLLERYCDLGFVCLFVFVFFLSFASSSSCVVVFIHSQNKLTKSQMAFFKIYILL